MPGQSLNAAEIYQQLTTGKGSESLGETHQAADKLSKSLEQRAARVSALAETLSGGFKGAASDEAVSNVCMPLMAASMDDSLHLTAARTAANDQMSAFQTAKNSVKPVSADKPELTAADLLDSLNGNSDAYSAKVSSWQADAQKNVDVFTGYHGASGTNSGRVPEQYSRLEDTGADVSLASADGQPKHPAHEPHPGGGWDGGPRPGRDHETPVPAPTPSPVSTPSPKPVPVPGPVPTPSPDPRPTPIPSPGPGPSRRPIEEPPILPPGDGRHPRDLDDERTRKESWPEPGPTPGPPRYQPGPPLNPIDLGQGNGVGGGGFGPLGYSPGGSGAGDSGGSRGGLGWGGEPGARGSGTAAKNSAAMGGGIGGKGSKGEEDKEKKAPSYLQEADPDGLFGGSEVRPTPPVIGERPQR
ncbi:hypothetical protein [Amycolatopsis sp. NPDC004079]|uniref:hypothetical protein n=1 Tax=Amycolatopsis sp. NPDC004079 TaxID=3154549 RepID=UPI0033A89FDB